MRRRAAAGRQPCTAAAAAGPRGGSVSTAGAGSRGVFSPGPDRHTTFTTLSALYFPVLDMQRLATVATLAPGALVAVAGRATGLLAGQRLSAAALHASIVQLDGKAASAEDEVQRKAVSDRGWYIGSALERAAMGLERAPLPPPPPPPLPPPPRLLTHLALLHSPDGQPHAVPCTAARLPGA
mgnify:CR=1 FL=1